MQDTCSNSSSIFFLVIDIEVTKTATSFQLVMTVAGIVAFLFAGIAFNVA